MIRGVTVDWWHTIVEPHGDDWEAVAKRMRCEAIQRVLAEHGITATYERLDVAYDLWTDHLKRAWRRAVDWSADEQILDLLASAGYDSVMDESLFLAMRAPIGAPLVAHPPRVHDGAIDTLRALKADGLRLAMISNTGRTWGRFLRQVQDRLGISDLFDHRTFSDEEQVRKPSGLIFERTLAALKLKPEEVVHVGDDLEADVAGARLAGMRAVWYDPRGRDDAASKDADAVIHSWRELPAAIRGW